MSLPDRDLFVSRVDAIRLLGEVVDERGPNHRYPKKLGVNGAPLPYYGEMRSVDEPAITAGQRRDRDESAACHYFATERDAALVKAVEEGAPMCIVGAVFDKLGLTAEDLGSLNISSGVEDVVTRLQLDDHFSAGALDVLSMAQEQQDGGLPWGRALEIALTMDATAGGGE